MGHSSARLNTKESGLTRHMLRSQGRAAGLGPREESLVVLWRQVQVCYLGLYDPSMLCGRVAARPGCFPWVPARLTTQTEKQLR